MLVSASALAKCKSFYVKIFLVIGKALTGELSCLVTDFVASLLSVVQLVKESTSKVFSFSRKGFVIQRSKKEVRKVVSLL